MRGIATTILRNPLTALIWGAVIVIALVLTLVASAQATDRSSFCSTCHEMTPYYTAWTEGPHAEVACIECHVDGAAHKRLAHKVTALGEVWAHFTGEPLFPMGTTTVPNDRCLRCHDGRIDPGIPGFDHEKHRRGNACQTCHFEVGHRVSVAALAEAGVLDQDALAAKQARVVATVGRGAANLAGHVTVGCSSCHDLEATGCASCHTPGHEPRGASTTCTDCHAPGPEWAFAHPARTDCANCHDAPAGHYEQTCSTCHPTPATFAFTHPAAGAECAACHERPAGHRQGACADCHTLGERWTFAHPAAGAPCTSCHTAPARHYQGACSACHRPSTPFSRTVFRHPGATATCTSCHPRPSGHASGACTTCHKPAVSWAFYHPTSVMCASCHAAPRNHYGTACVSCHSPSARWGSATFSHPKVPGGEHTYKSFACTKCHPSGYDSLDCTSCHEKEDD